MRPRVFKSKWMKQVSHVLARVDVVAGSMLVVMVQKNRDSGRWGAFAVETGVDAEFLKLTDSQVYERVFEDHGHAVIGDFKLLREARAAGVAYARKWTPRSLRCACETIGAPPPRLLPGHPDTPTVITVDESVQNLAKVPKRDVVTVGGVEFEVVEVSGRRCFVADPWALKLRALRVVDLNVLAAAYRAGEFSQREYLRFYTSTGYSVDGLCELSFFSDLEVLDPVGGDREGRRLSD